MTVQYQTQITIYKREIGWLLKEKYQWDQQQVIKFIDNRNLHIANSDLSDDLDRLFSGEPISYIIGNVKFLGNKIDLSLKPLIPRPETEYWVEKVINKHLHRSKLSVLDLCCGSGCIGIAILSHIPGSRVDFVDIDQLTLDQTEINLKLNKLNATRYHLIKSDLFKKLRNSKYDLILTNPPYVNRESPYDKSLKYEPEIALFASDFGLSIIKDILVQFPRYLKPDSELIMEHGEEQLAAISDYCSKINLHPAFQNDQFSVPRYLSLTSPLSLTNIKSS